MCMLVRLQPPKPIAILASGEASASRCGCNHLGRTGNYPGWMKTPSSWGQMA